MATVTEKKRYLHCKAFELNLENFRSIIPALIARFYIEIYSKTFWNVSITVSPKKMAYYSSPFPTAPYRQSLTIHSITMTVHEHCNVFNGYGKRKPKWWTVTDDKEPYFFWAGMETKRFKNERFPVILNAYKNTN